MKILILSNNCRGIYHFRSSLIKKMIEEKNVVYVVAPPDDLTNKLSQLKINFIPIQLNRRGMNPFKDFTLLFNYLKLIRSLKPDKIITYTIKPNLYGGLAAMFLHKDYAINITGLGTSFQKENLLKRIVTIWYRLVCLRVKVVFFENEGNKQVFIENQIVNERKCCVLHGAGVNLDDFYFTAYPPQSSPLHFLFIGRVMKEKGVDELLEAASRIKMDYPDIIFDFVGPMEDDYQDVIASYVTKGIIQYHGYQEDVRPFIQQCHCFVLPSYHEGMANTLLECASMGRPLITSDIHGCKEAISDNGFLCQVQDAQDLYQKLLAFIALPYKRKKQMGLNSRKHMEAVFDKKKVVEETLKGLRKEDDDE